MSVERTRGGKAVLIKTSGVIIDLTLTEAKELRKQLDEALKDPLEGYGLPWVMNPENHLVSKARGYSHQAQLQTMCRAFASLSEAEQREFLMRGLS